MAIQRLEIDGYRSFERAVWEPGKLNLLVGPNASGKSNLLRLLEFIADVAAGRLEKAVNKAGGMVPLLWNQEAHTLGWRLTIDPRAQQSTSSDRPFTFTLGLARRGGGAYALAWEELNDWSECPNVRFSVGYRRLHDSLAVYHGDSSVSSQSPSGLVPSESLLPQVSDPVANPFVASTKRLLESWRVYHGLEIGPESVIRRPFVPQYSKLVEPDGSNVFGVLHTLYEGGRDFKREIDEGMTAAFGEEFESVKFLPASRGTMQLALQWRSSRTPHYCDTLSDGTLRFLFLLTILASPEPPPLIAIDEPEVGLHPSMLSIIAEYAVAAAERTQVVISSHSPEFLDCFTDCEPRVTVFHWEDGRSHLYNLPDGKLKKWLELYRLGQLFTSGELDVLTLPEVEPLPDAEERFRDLPPQDAELPPQQPATEGPPRD